MTRYWLALLLLLPLIPVSNAFDAHEWLIAVQDHNADEQVHLPPFVTTRSQRAIGTGPPPPHGGIILTGTPPKLLDVVITLSENSTFDSVWPAAKSRGNSASWTALKPTAATLKPTALDWWQKLRADRPAFGADGEADNLIFYTANFKSVHDYRLSFDEAGLALLEVRDGATMPAKAWVLKAGDDAWAGSPLEVSKPTTTDAPTTSVADILSKSAAEAPPALLQHLQQTITAALVDGRRAALLQLPGEAALPASEILPLPDAHRRHLFVVIVDRDVRTKAEWESLIAQLGAPAWTERETAMLAIAETGKSALPYLNEALKNKNLEIVDRAERLIMRLGHDPGKIDAKLKKQQLNVQQIETW